MNRFENSSSPMIDKVASNLRTQIINLHNILDAIERTHQYEDGYILESIKESEIGLRRLRKFIES